MADGAALDRKVVIVTGAGRGIGRYGPGENRTAQRVSAQRPSKRCNRTDLRRAHERNLSDEPIAPYPFGASVRGLDLPLDH